MILTPQRRAALTKELSFLTAESLLSVVKTSAGNAATILSTFGDPHDIPSSDAFNLLYIRCDELLSKLHAERMYK